MGDCQELQRGQEVLIKKKIEKVYIMHVGGINKSNDNSVRKRKVDIKIVQKAYGGVYENIGSDAEWSLKEDYQ